MCTWVTGNQFCFLSWHYNFKSIYVTWGIHRFSLAKWQQSFGDSLLVPFVSSAWPKMV